MNYYERHIGDYLKDTAHLSLLEHGIYARLLDVYYTRESAISDAHIARLIGARTKEEQAALRSVLTEFFVQEPGGDWTQPRCEREIERYQRKAEHNREVGKLGGRPRKTETQTKPPGLSAGSEKGTQIEPRPNPPSLQSPVTSNQSPYSGPDGPAADEAALTKAELWSAGKSLLAAQGMPAAQCGSFVGKLVKDHGEAVVVDAVRSAVVKRPADAAEWLVSACQRRAGKRGAPPPEAQRQAANDAANAEAKRLLGINPPEALHA